MGGQPGRPIVRWDGLYGRIRGGAPVPGYAHPGQRRRTELRDNVHADVHLHQRLRVPALRLRRGDDLGHVCPDRTRAGGAVRGGSAGKGGATNSAGTSGAPSASGSSGSAGTPAGGASGAGGGAGGANAGTAGGSSVKGCNWTGSEGKTVLFDGTSLDQWQATSSGKAAPWRLDAAEKVVEVVPGQGNIQSKAEFESICLHIEYLTPMYPPSVTGQERGNSGIYLKRAYEMQVLDSAGQPAAINTCGAVYGVRAPLVVACNEQLVWNTYEIEFKASQWAGNDKTSNAVIVSATLNGELVQQNVELDVTSTEAGQPDAPGSKPLMLQDHNNPVRFRNIWIKVPID